MPEVEAALSTSDDALFVAASVDGTVVGGYVLRRSDMSFEMIGLAINPAFRKRGIGKMCCMDALFRAGKSPLVLTANAESEAFAKTVGFKLVGKRKQPDGTFLIRMGWHAPRPGADPNDPLAC
jgi:RimJ/RimL family protein N-acetyltransferase